MYGHLAELVVMKTNITLRKHIMEREDVQSKSQDIV